MRTAVPVGRAGSAGSTTLAAIRSDPLGFLAARAARHPDRWWHRSGDERVHVVNHPDLARHVLRDNHVNYTKAGTPDDEMLTPLLGEGLLTTDGEVWARQRRLAAPSFRRQEVERFDGLITRAALDLADGWREAAHAGQPVRVDHDLTALTRRELHDQVLTMIMAGHETTAKALTWTLHLLGGHPEVTAAVAAELETVLGGRVPSASDLPKLVLTRAALDEAIRIFPPVWLL